MIEKRCAGIKYDIFVLQKFTYLLNSFMTEVPII